MSQVGKNHNHSGSILIFQVDVWNRSAEVDLTNYVPNGEWTLLYPPLLVRIEKFYQNLPEPFPEITITLHIRRKTLYYM